MGADAAGPGSTLQEPLLQHKLSQEWKPSTDSVLSTEPDTRAGA